MRRAWGRHRQRGATAVTVALLLLALGGFAALVVNVGHLFMVRGQLQNACDSAALAGAKELDGTPGGLSRAVAKAAQFGDRFTTDRSVPVQLSDQDIVLGHWDWARPKSQAFTPISVSDPGAPLLVNAVRVLTGRSDARGNPLDVFLSAFSGNQTTAHIDAEAVAAGGGPALAPCAVPFVFADCLLQQDDQIQCNQKLVLKNDQADNMGFTNLDPGVASVSTSDIISIFSGSCRSVAAGDSIGVSNGNNLNKNVVDAVNQYIAQNGAKVTVPVVSPIGGCPAQFNRVLPVVGFASFTITNVTGPPSPSVEIQLDCNATTESERAGGGFFGTTDPHPGLVR